MISLRRKHRFVRAKKEISRTCEGRNGEERVSCRTCILIARLEFPLTDKKCIEVTD